MNETLDRPGHVRGGKCDRCNRGAPADWWHNNAKCFVCEDCAFGLNEFLAGLCSRTGGPPPKPGIDTLRASVAREQVAAEVEADWIAYVNILRARLHAAETALQERTATIWRVFQESLTSAHDAQLAADKRNLPPEIYAAVDLARVEE